MALSQPLLRNHSIFSLPPVARRGRKPRKFLPNGVQEPSRSELVDYLITHILYQYEPGFDDGPLFCCHVRPPRQRGECLVQIVMGPPQFTGAWAIASDPRSLILQVLWNSGQETWVPRLQISPGNIDPIDRLNGTELSPVALRRAILRHRWITEDIYDRFVQPDPAQREQAIAFAVPGIWM